MAYDLLEHRHRFAVWAAARAAQRGFTSVKNLRDALESTDIQVVLSAAETLDVKADRFEILHEGWCSAICARLNRRGIAKVTYGRAAKLVAVYLKATVIMGDAWDTSLGRNLHPPIDRILLQGLASSNRIASRHKSSWRSINWTQLDRPSYKELIEQLKDAVPGDAPFWTIEEYWEPSD